MKRVKKSDNRADKGEREHQNGKIRALEKENRQLVRENARLIKYIKTLEATADGDDGTDLVEICGHDGCLSEKFSEFTVNLPKGPRTYRTCKKCGNRVVNDEKHLDTDR